MERCPCSRFFQAGFSPISSPLKSHVTTMEALCGSREPLSYHIFISRRSQVQLRQERLLWFLVRRNTTCHHAKKHPTPNTKHPTVFASCHGSFGSFCICCLLGRVPMRRCRNRPRPCRVAMASAPDASLSIPRRASKPTNRMSCRT